MALNLLLGWTLIVWIVCLIWSFINKSQQTIIIQNEKIISKDKKNE
ncbi:superinfection immunity protein [Campylobacter insulaenigrae]|nr:superinfection immunity protein [Campylobacter insulaenigrae]MCR6587610.1 superinfection immunity protein [Campylobacter insulaenigrae]